jgi:hypothetical protein
MWRALITVGAVVALTAPAFAAETTTVIEKRTTVTREVPGSGTTVTTTAIAPNPPPPPRVEVAPPLPFPAAVWTPGHWRWNPGQQDYSWVGGVYLSAPQGHAVWVPGDWRQEPPGWVWTEGRWD